MRVRPAALLSALLTLCSLPATPARAAGPAGAAPLVVTGRVTADGRPLAGARIALSPWLGDYEEGRRRLDGIAPRPAAVVARAMATTDAEGWFEVAVPAAGVWKLVAEAPGRVPLEYGLVPLLDSTVLPDAELPADSGLVLRVTDAAGRPLPARVAVRPADREGLRLYALLGGRWVPGARLATADGEGRVRLPQIAGEELALAAFAAGHLPASLAVKGAPPAVVTLAPGEERALRVVDAQGRPIAGALVWDGQEILPLGVTDEAGMWTAGVPAGAGAPAVHVTGPAGEAGSARLEKARAPATAPLLVRLLPPPHLAGTVLDTATRAPLSGAWVLGPGEPARTDAAGRYSVALEPGGTGPGMIYARAAGHLPGFAEGSGDGPGPTIALDPAARLTGEVVDAAGQPVARAEVRVTVGGLAIASASLSGPGGEAVLSGRDGRFLLAALPAQTPYELAAGRPGEATGKLAVTTPEPFATLAGLRIVVPAGGRATGRVVDGEGRPVAGAEVRSYRLPAEIAAALEVDPAITRQLGEPGAVAATDAAGRFTLTGLGDGYLAVEVEAAGFARATPPAIQLDGPEGPEGIAGLDEKTAEIDLGTITLAPAVGVEGLVVDGEGRPLAGAAVRDQLASYRQKNGASPRQGTSVVTGADGRFVLGGLAAGQSLALKAVLDGYAGPVLQGIVAPTTQPVRLVLQPTGRLAGRVLDTDRRPVAGAIVSVDTADGGEIAGRSEADGRFTLEGIPAGEVTLFTLATGFPPHTLNALAVPPGGERGGVEVILSRGATVEGQVLGADRKPVVGALVVLFDPGAGEEAQEDEGTFAPTDGEGRYRIAGATPGPRAVAVQMGPRAGATRNLEVRPGVNTLDIVLDPAFRAAGRVVAEAGDPHAGPIAGDPIPAVPLVLLSLDGGDQQQTTSGVDGSFAFTGLPPGGYRIVATDPSPPAAEGARFEIAGADVSGLEVRIRRPVAEVTLTGRILGAAPAELAEVSLLARGNGGLPRSGQADADGGYRIGGLSAGEWRVSARQRDGRHAEATLSIPEGATEATLDLELSPPGTVLSGVVRRGGEPVAGAWLSLLGGPGEAGAATAVRTSTRTNQNGAFRLAGLVPGTYRLEVQSATGGLDHREELTLDGDREVAIELVAGRIAGFVRDARDGSAVAGARVELGTAGPAGADPSFSGPVALTDARGYFTLSAPVGRWRIGAMRSGYAAGEIGVEIADGETASGVELRLDRTEGITFEVALAGGAVPAEVQLAVFGPWGASAAGRYPVTDGRVRVSTVPDGSWTLAVQAGDSAALSVAITAPGPLGRLVLPPAGWVQVALPETAAPAGGEGQSPASLLSPISTVSVVAFDAAGNPYTDLANGRLQSATSLVGGKGWLRLPSGTWQLLATAADGRTWRGTAEVAANGRFEVTLE